MRIWNELRADYDAAKRGEYRISGGRGRVYAKYGRGPMDTRIPALARLTTELTVIRANGTVVRYTVGKNGELITITDSLWQTFTRTLAKTLLPMFSMARSLRRRITT